jgi:flavodoxin
MMMKWLIVYDSQYGNTEKIAQSMGSAITDDVQVLKASEARGPEVQSVDVLMVGSPTQAFRATQPVQEFLRSIPKDGLKGMHVAAFDTRFLSTERGVGLRFILKVGGYAAPRIANTLEKKGGTLVVPAEGFFVTDKEGPLKEGELERAANWARTIMKSITS